MSFDFDSYINKPCVGDGIEEGIFGRIATYYPQAGGSYQLTVDFHKGFQEIQFNTAGEVVSGDIITGFVRLSDMASPPIQDEEIDIDGSRFKIYDVRKHIPGSRQLILHRK